MCKPKVPKIENNTAPTAPAPGIGTVGSMGVGGPRLQDEQTIYGPKKSLRINRRKAPAVGNTGLNIPTK